MPDEAPREAEGRIVSFQGAVVDIRFEGPQPPLNRMLRSGREGEVVIEVAALFGPGLVRGLALNVDHGLALGMAVRGQRPSRHAGEMGEEIGCKAERKLKARGEQDRGVWFGLGMFGLVSWSVAVPTVLGAALGIWLDAQFGSRIAWTLTFLFIGLGIGCLLTRFWVKKESRDD